MRRARPGSAGPDDAVPAARRRRRARLVTITVAALVAGVLGTSGPAWAGTRPSSNWKDYVLGQGTAQVRPVEVTSATGDVRFATSVTRQRGRLVLTMVPGGPAPVVVLDYGVDVGGIPFFDVKSVTGAPTLRASFTESLRFADADGDNGGLGPCCGAAPPAAEANRWNEFTPTGPGTLRTEYQQGGQRYERLTLTTPGSVTLSAVGIDFAPFVATPDAFQGHFLSSDDTLNRIWYAGAYTQALDMVPPGAQNGNRYPAVVDGAKRDRAIWSGDLVVQNPTGWVTYGSTGAEYMRASLERLALTQRANGLLAGSVRLGPTLDSPFALYYSATYSMHAANTMVDYYRYTGDEAFAREQLSTVRKQLEFDRSLVDDRGLLVTGLGQGDTPPPPICCALDWDAYDPPKIGAVSAYNMVYFHTLREAAWLEAQLGNGAESSALESEAATLREAINANLWNTGLGLYDLSDTARGQYAEDANSMAVLWGVAPDDQRDGILARLKERLWVPAGVQHFSDNAVGYQLDVLTPFATGFETAARLEDGDIANALDLYHRHWGPQVDPATPDYVGSLWEKVALDGSAVVDDGSNPIDNNSLAHGWSSAPTSQLSEYVLGVRPIGPGYREFVVAPELDGLQWAQGTVPTAYGAISVDWQNRRGSQRIDVQTPDGATGTIEVPAAAGTRVRITSKAGTQRIDVTDARTISVPVPSAGKYTITVDGRR